MKTNYRAWSIPSEDFADAATPSEKLLFFARYGVLAPSGHNTQPWQFQVDGDDLIISADHSRMLPYSGVKANEPYVSLGSCIGVLELAAKAFGYELGIKYLKSGDQVARISIKGKVKPDPKLADAITNRVSNRQDYKTEPLPEALFESIVKTTYDRAYSLRINDRKEIEYLADQTSKATFHIMGDKKFRAELSKWVRNNITNQFDGMPGFVQGIPTPPSLLARFVIKYVDMSKDQSKKDTRRILRSADLVIMGVKDDSKEALLDAGRLFSKTCVRAAQNGVASTGLGSAIIDPITRENIVKKYSLPGKPIAIVRLGYAVKQAKHAPRWPLEKVLAKSSR